MSENSAISVILPSYNEKENIIDLIRAIGITLKDIEYEIIVIDDKSPDRTYEAVRDSGLPCVVAVKNTALKGLGRSVRIGIEKARFDLIAVMDSDGEHNPSYLASMLEIIEDHDCISASRFLKGGGVKNKFHHCLSFIFNVFIRIATKSALKDNLYGYFLVKRRVLEQLDFNLIFFGYGDYYMRLLYYMQSKGFSICEIPAVHGRRQYGIRKTRFLKTFALYFLAVLDIVFNKKVKCCTS